MYSKFTILFISLLIGAALHAQQPATDTALEKINKALPHKFKELKTGVTLEAVREQGVVKLYMLIDDIEQYDEILVERSGAQGQNYSQCKEIKVEKGKYKNNYIEAVDQYPVAYQMSNTYRVKAITKDGVVKMFPPVPIMAVSDGNAGK